MNIEYTPETIETLKQLEAEIRKENCAARNAMERAIKLSHQIDALHVKSEHDYLERQILAAKAV